MKKIVINSGGSMKIKKINMKKAAVSCAAICLAGALCWNGSSITAWAAPTSGTAINDNTRVRSAIGGSPIGSLKAKSGGNHQRRADFW